MCMFFIPWTKSEFVGLTGLNKFEELQEGIRMMKQANFFTKF